jgi:hypothetical protein
LNTKSKHAPITHDFFLLTILFNFGTKIKNDCTIEKQEGWLAGKMELIRSCVWQIESVQNSFVFLAILLGGLRGLKIEYLNTKGTK